MSYGTKIEWAHHTFNPWIGCTKVGPGCDNCYAEADFDKRRHVVAWGTGQPRKRTSKSNWAQPLKWNHEAERLNVRYRVFCASLADVFDNEVPTDWRRDLCALIQATPHLDWLVLTKRIGNARGMLNECSFGRWNEAPLPNIWIGITVTNQSEADRDIPKLLSIPASVRFLSMEPLLGPVDIHHRLGHCVFSEVDAWATGCGVNWVIVGGESGPKARPMHPQWARDLRDQCETSGIPFLFKQWGEWAPRSACYHTIDQSGLAFVDLDPGASKWPCIRMTEGGGNGWGIDEADTGDHAYMQRVGKKLAGRLLEGIENNGYPEVNL